MVEFKRLDDLNLVRVVFTRPGVFPYIGDDFSPSPDDFQPNEDPRIWYVGVFDEDRIVGIFTFLPENSVCWQGHVSMLRGVKPAITSEAGERIMPWFWENIGAERLTASIPATNRAAVRYAETVMGLHRYGINEQSFMKYGKLQDQILLGISRSQPCRA